jgi:hypothetical protein
MGDIPALLGTLLLLAAAHVHSLIKVWWASGPHPTFWASVAVGLGGWTAGYWAKTRRRADARWRYEAEERTRRMREACEARWAEEARAERARIDATRRAQEEAKGRTQNAARAAASRAWWDVLDIAPDATFEEAKSAYRRKMHLCHPDRVSGLAPEFTALAERMSRELNAALAEAKEHAPASAPVYAGAEAEAEDASRPTIH